MRYDIFNLGQDGFFESLSKEEPEVTSADNAADRNKGGMASQLRAQIEAELTDKPLDPKYEALFNNGLFPPDRMTKAQKADPLAPRPDQYHQFGESLINLNVRIKLVQTFLSGLMQDSAHINAKLMMEKRFPTGGAGAGSTLIAMNFKRIEAMLQRLNTGDLGLSQPYVRTQISAAMDNLNNLVIKRTDKGFLLQNVAIGEEAAGLWNPFVSRGSNGVVSAVPDGLATSLHSMGSSAEFEAGDITADTAEPSFREFYASGFLSEFGQAVDNAQKVLHKTLFGDAPSKKAINTKIVHHNLDLDLTAVNAAINKIPGVREACGSLMFFPPTLTVPAVKKNLGKLFSFTVARCPLNGTARKFLVSRSAEQRTARYNVDRIPESLLAYNSVQIVVGYSVNLPTEVVDYITQSEDHSSAELLLARWFTRWSRNFFCLAGSRGVSRSTVPRCLTSSTNIKRLNDMRKKLGFEISDSIGDADGVTISGKGAIVVYPRTSDIDLDVVAENERLLSSQLSKLYEKGLPLDVPASRQSIYDLDIMVEGATVDTAGLTREFHAATKNLANAVVGVDPSSGLVLRTGTNFLSLNTLQEDGAVPAGFLELGHALGHDFAKPGETATFTPGAITMGAALRYNSSEERNLLTSAFTRTVISLINRRYNFDGAFDIPHSSFRTANWESLTSSSNPNMLFYAVSVIANTYQWMADRGLVPHIDSLMSVAQQQQLEYTHGYEPDAQIENLIDYGNYIDSPMTSSELIAYYAAMAITDARAHMYRSKLAQLYSSNGQAAEVENDWRYLPEIRSSGMYKIANLRGYLGGSLLLAAAKAIFGADRRKVFSELTKSNAFPADFMMQAVLPTAFMFGHAVPNHREYFEKIEQHIENMEPGDPSEEDLKMAGTVDHTFMPHQFKAQGRLAKAVPPPYALLDIHPGGGKTILGIHDILWCASVTPEPIKPAVICPKGLVGNWCEDLHLVSHDWNVVPLTTETVKEWGLERIQNLLANAPRNTIYVIADTFLSNHHGRFDADIGGARVSIMAQGEFMRRYKFNYVILDESHRVKNSESGVHAAIKQMFLQSTVKYKRLATGTLVPDRVSDVVGQAAMFTPGIFGDGSKIEDADRVTGSTDTNAIDAFNRKVTAMRSTMANYVQMVTAKRREWAFMLPNPIETFLHFPIDDPSVPNSNLHRMAYEAIYTRLVEMAMQEAAKGKKAGGTDEDAGELDDEDATGDEEDTEPDDISNVIRGNVKLRQYWQRMEQVLSDPMGDPEARKIFEEAGVKDFIPAKMRVIVDRVKRHFHVQKTFKEAAVPNMRDGEEVASEHQMFEWFQGCRPFENDVAVYEGKRYLARKKRAGVAARFRLPPSDVPPPQDLEYWKPEQAGKVIVLCEYNRSGNAVVAALKKLDPDLAKHVIRLGEGADTKEMVEKFRNSDEAQILVANEPRITEGYNMQIGSRIIRCDTPWQPGRVRQSHARIMRPDFSTAIFDDSGKPGDMKREVIFIDWVMTNHTMEVVKVARVTAKDVKTTLFDESDNPRYKEIQKWAVMQEPPYNLTVFQQKEWLDIETYQDPDDPTLQHIDAKTAINEIDRQEFAEMRESSVAAMRKVEGSPVDPNAGFRTLDRVPFVPNQKVYDRWDYGLVPFRQWYKQRSATTPFTDNRADYREAFNGLPVMTEWGEGIIYGISTINGARFDDPELRQADPAFINLRVMYPDGSERLVGVGRTFIAMKAISDPAGYRNIFAGRNAKAPVPKTKADTAREEGRKKREAEVIKEDERVIKEISEEVSVEIGVSREVGASGQKRASNVKKGKNANDGIAPIADGTDRTGAIVPIKQPGDRKPKQPRVPVEPVAEAVNVINVNPVVYNGLLAMYVSTDDSDYKQLVKKFGFKEFGEFVYADSYYLKDFYAHLDFLDSIYGEGPFDQASANRLGEIQDVFANSGRKQFTYPIAYKLKNEVIEFYRARHRDASKLKLLKVYPAFLRDRMRMMIDLKTNPMARKLIGKRAPGALAKFAEWKLHEGMAINFVGTVTEARKLLKELQRGGYTIANAAEVVKVLADVKIRPDADEKRK